MYEKNLKEDLRLRLSEEDMTFLRKIADERGTSISQVIRSILGDYRRALESMETLKLAVQLAKEKDEKEKLSNGDTKTNLEH